MFFSNFGFLAYFVSFPYISWSFFWILKPKSRNFLLELSLAYGARKNSSTCKVNIFLKLWFSRLSCVFPVYFIVFFWILKPKSQDFPARAFGARKI